MEAVTEMANADENMCKEESLRRYSKKEKKLRVENFRQNGTRKDFFCCFHRICGILESRL